MSLIVVSLLSHEGLLLSLKVKQLGLQEFQRFDLLMDMLSVLVWKHSEENTFEIESFTPLCAIGLRQLACEDLPLLCLLRTT